MKKTILLWLFLLPACGVAQYNLSYPAAHIDTLLQIVNRPEICFGVDSSALSYYGTRLQTGLVQTFKAFNIDSVIVAIRGAAGDTVAFQVLWGASYGTATDSLQTTATSCFNRTTGTRLGASSFRAQAIPAQYYVWIVCRKKTGNPNDVLYKILGSR